MARGRTDLASREYDEYLASQGKERELRERKLERQKASRNYDGWHFGIDEKGPVRTRDKEEFRRELDKRGLMMEDDVKGKSIVDRKGLIRESDNEKKRRG